MTEIATNYCRVVEAVAEEAQRCGRIPQEITIVAAAKTKGADEVRAAIAAGAQDIGENYVQEAQAKIETIGKPVGKPVGEPVRWHLIGHLQRNKARVAVRLFALIQSLDSLELARELNRQGEKLDSVVRTLVEVNLAGEKTKSGISKEALRDLLEELRVLPFLRVEGLMTVPPYSPNPEDSRPYFRELVQLRQEHGALGIANVELRELSMGMTEDYPVAIEEGATIVRIGRAIFGERH
jgi:PLP dependent protein